MQQSYNIYKGLQKPLEYKGFRGKFIYWGIASLLLGLVFGAIVMATLSMLAGVLVLVIIMLGGLAYTAKLQKNGLHHKTRSSGHYLFASTIKYPIYDKKE
ncbi:plasmid transfer protein [Pedobacter foliorum]|uniref:plasmid transfer protein n=1 Tax=Pedobacter foliorum TaxID=2739058 RepID=UPI0015656FAB|nr:plasmid transfer protein [Pedobacter foliorum]NRF37553.1 plasmid transfer protein [Pedobacter foliorum]